METTVWDAALTSLVSHDVRTKNHIVMAAVSGQTSMIYHLGPAFINHRPGKSLESKYPGLRVPQYFPVEVVSAIGYREGIELHDTNAKITGSILQSVV